MSHAAIVSREYGLPAVVGTGFGTKQIENGQQIRVDGNTGAVAPGVEVDGQTPRERERVGPKPEAVRCRRPRRSYRGGGEAPSVAISRWLLSTESSEDDIGVLGIDVEQVRSCGRSARSPTHSAGTIGRKPNETASIVVARTQPLVHTLRWSTVSTCVAVRNVDSGVPKMPKKARFR